DFASAVCPVWSPDGKSLLFEGARDPGGPMDWWIAALNEGQPIKTGATEQFQRHGLVLSPAACTVGWVNDAIIFPARLGDSTNLWRTAISPSGWRIARPPQRLTFGTALEVHPSAGRNGEVVFSSLSENVDVWSLRMEANQAVVTSEMERLTE